MAKWLLIAALATIGVTALLIGVLYRANRKLLEQPKRDGGETSVAISADAGGARRMPDGDAAQDGGDAGGDGGGD